MGEENQGVGYIFGLSTVLLGLCFIMSMGVFSVYHPYKLGIAKCGDPPEIAAPGFVIVNAMEAVYSCPQDQRLYGIEKRTCDEKEKAWQPAKDQASKSAELIVECFSSFNNYTHYILHT